MIRRILHSLYRVLGLFDYKYKHKSAHVHVYIEYTCIRKYV